jgi:hypothetical protein
MRGGLRLGTASVACERGPQGGDVRRFKMLVTDDRPGRSDFVWVQASSEMRGREIAERTFNETPHRVSVELWEADELIFVVGTRRARGSRA